VIVIKSYVYTGGRTFTQ